MVLYMKKKHYGMLSLAVASYLTAYAENGKQNTDKPNVILIYADDLGYGDLECYGAKNVQTPNVNRLASKGIRFTNAHATAATSTPSRYSMLTGEYAWRKPGTDVAVGNAGMIIRTADALGIDGIIMSNSCDLYSPKVIRSTMGSVFRTNIFIENNTEKLFEILDVNKINTSAAVIDTDAESINICGFSGKQAVFIGNEGNGLPKEVSVRCNRCITIPMNGSINSLNAAMAAGIIMWELKK